MVECERHVNWQRDACQQLLIGDLQFGFPDRDEHFSIGFSNLFQLPFSHCGFTWTAVHQESDRFDWLWKRFIEQYVDGSGRRRLVQWWRQPSGREYTRRLVN